MRAIWAGDRGEGRAAPGCGFGDVPTDFFGKALKRLHSSADAGALYLYVSSIGSANVVKVVIKSLKTGRLSKVAVGKKRVATPDGGWKTVWTLDIHHPKFDDGMLYVFRRNVAKARRENKKILGVADFVPPKR
jgi:hypothetical protein